MTRWHAAALAVGWLLAAVTIWYSGWWYAHTNRHDDCTLATLGPQPFWACPANDVRIEPRRSKGAPA